MSQQQNYKRQPRQALSPEELLDFINRKKRRQQKIIERFKKTKTYKALNLFNVISVVIYSELIISFFGICNYYPQYLNTISYRYYNEVKGGKRSFGNVILNSVSKKTYEININDTCFLPERFSRFYVGRDYIYNKDLKIKLEQNNKSYVIVSSAPYLFISCLCLLVTFISFNSNLNQVRYSLVATSLMNLLSLLSFVLLQ